MKVRKLGTKENQPDREPLKKKRRKLNRSKLKDKNPKKTNYYCNNGPPPNSHADKRDAFHRAHTQQIGFAVEEELHVSGSSYGKSNLTPLASGTSRRVSSSLRCNPNGPAYLELVFCFFFFLFLFVLLFYFSFISNKTQILNSFQFEQILNGTKFQILNKIRIWNIF
jgi:hypothetical protein